MVDPVTFLTGFDGLPLSDISGVSRWLDHVIALTEERRCADGAGDRP